MATFRGPLTSPACSQAAYGLLFHDENNHRLELYEHDPTLLARSTPLICIQLSDYDSVNSGDIQQGLQWDIVLSCTSPLHRQALPSNSGKLSSNLAKLRRKSSIGGAKAIERLSQSTSSSSEAPSGSSSPSQSTASPSSSKSAAWLKSKLRSKSISATAASSQVLSSNPQQPLPANASAIIARNTGVSPGPASPPAIGTDTPPRRPSTANANEGSQTKARTPLVLSTISRDLQLRWIEVPSSAIAPCVTKAQVAQVSSSMTTSSSIPLLAVHASPAQIASDLSGYAFPRKPPPSPLRVTATTNQALLSSQSATTSPTTSFLEIGPDSSSRSSTPSSNPTNDTGPDSPCTAMPNSSAGPTRRISGTPNPLLPQWLSDVRRNSSGGFVLDDHQARHISRSPSPAGSSSSPHTSSSSHFRMPTPVILERPTMRQSKSSSFLNLDPRKERAVFYSPPIGHMASPFPDRGIKISIHPDEEDEHEDYARTPETRGGLSASQPARSRRVSAQPKEVVDSRSYAPVVHTRPAFSSSTSSSHRYLDVQQPNDSRTATSPTENLLRTSQYGNFLRPSPSSTSLASSNAASSLYGGGESVSSLAQSADPPTPCPPSVENLGPPQSCELTPTCISPEGNSKMKLQGYFGVPQDIVDNPTEIRSPLAPMDKKNKKERDNREADGSFPNKVPFHARLGAVFTGSSSTSHRTAVVSSPPLNKSEDKDRESIRSTTSSVSMSNSSCITSRQSVTSPVSSRIDSASTSRKSSYDQPGNVKPDIGRHIIDPAELRRLMQERLDRSTSSLSSSSHIKNARRPAAGTGMKKSVSMQAALESYARSPPSAASTIDNLSSSTNTSPDTTEYTKYTFGKAHPAQAPPASFSPVKERSKPLYSPSVLPSPQSRMPRSESAHSVNVQALFAALPPPKRRSAGPVRPSTSGAVMPTLQESNAHSINS